MRAKRSRSVAYMHSERWTRLSEGGRGDIVEMR